MLAADAPRCYYSKLRLDMMKSTYTPTSMDLAENFSEEHSGIVSAVTVFNIRKRETAPRRGLL
jgi:hypothetical protein